MCYVMPKKVIISLHCIFSYFKTMWGRPSAVGSFIRLYSLYIGLHVSLTFTHYKGEF